MRTARRRYLQVRTRDHQESRAMVSCTLLFPLAFLILLPFPLSDARTRLFPSRLSALTFWWNSDWIYHYHSSKLEETRVHATLGILPTPHFSTHLPSPSSLRRSDSFPKRSGPPQRVSSTPVSRSSSSTLGAHPLSFSSLPSP